MNNLKSFTPIQYQLLKEMALESVYPLNHNESLYQLNARLPIPTGYEKLNESKLKYLWEPFVSSSIKPADILIYKDSISICWVANFHQMVVNKEIYLNLVLEFAAFLDTFNIDDLRLNTGFFNDSPNDIQLDSKYPRNYNPHFNSDCFGKISKHRVIDFR
jgi:hypothetical protein